AVSIITAFSVNHQSHSRVPPTPATAPWPISAANGKRRPALSRAVVLPAPGDIQQEVHAGPDQQHQDDDAVANQPPLERRQQRAEEPDQGGQQGGSDEAEEPA